MPSEQVVTEPRSWKGEREPQGQAVFVYPGDGAHNSKTKGQTLLPWEMVFEAASCPAGTWMERPQHLSCQVIFVILAGKRSEAGSVRFRDTLIQGQKGPKYLLRRAPSPGTWDPHPTAPAARQTQPAPLVLSKAHAAPPSIPKRG